MTTALVIGAGGQIGSDLVPALIAAGHETYMLDLRPPEETAAHDRLCASLADDPDWKSRWITADGSSPELADTIARLKPDRVYHLAALLSATGEANPDLCWKVNLESLRIALDALHASPTKRPVIVWPSSIAAFGPLPDGRAYDGHERVPDDFPLHPTTMYGVTKVAGELLGAWYAAQRDVDFRSVRFPGLLSGTPPGGGSSDYANEMYFAAARSEDHVEVFVEPGTRMPFMHMDDAVSALMELADADEARLTRRTYNLSAFAPTAEQFAAAIVAANGALDVTWAPDHRNAFVASWPDDVDASLAARDWGFKPQLDLAATTERLLADIRQLLAV